MSENNGARFRVDAADLTLLEHAEAVKAAEPYKDHPAAADFVVAGMVWQTQLRTDPTFTYEQALGLKFSELEIVGGEDETAGEAPRASSGAPPQLSAEPGASVPVP